MLSSYFSKTRCVVTITEASEIMLVVGENDSFVTRINSNRRIKSTESTA
jgi:hypothetical protein